jgi:hypothetical protein
MAISGLMSNTALPPALLATAEQPALAAGDIVAARVVGQSANGASQLAIGKQVLTVALPEHPPTGTVLLLQVAAGESGRRFTVLAEVPPEAAAHTALVPPNARLRLQALGLVPGEVFTGTAAGRTAGGLTRLAIGDTLVDMLLPRPVASGEAVRLQMPRDRSDPALLRLVDGEAAPSPARHDQIALDPRTRAALSRLGVTPGAPVTVRVTGPNLVSIGDEVLHLPLPRNFPVGTQLNLQRSSGSGDHLLLLSAAPPGVGAAEADAVRISPASLPVLHELGVKPGQRLDAEVVGRLTGGETEIVINGRKLAVTLPTPSAAGSRVTLTVQGTAEQPRLALLLKPAAAPPADLAGLRQMALADQGSLGTVLAGLARLQGAPSAIMEAAAPLQQAPLPADGAIAAADLKQALRNSGIFLEAANTPVAGDIKAALMGLRGALAGWLGLEAAPSGARRPLPPTRGSLPRAHHVPLAAGDTVEPRTLLADTDAALNRLRLMQIASLPDPSLSPVQKAALFTAEIPLQFGNELSLAQFQVMRDGGGQAAPEAPGERGWQMRFAVNYAVLGEVGAQITLRGKRVSVALWAERQATAEALETLLPELGPGLAARGIEPVALHCRLGRPSEARAAPSGQYVDALK